MQTVPADLQDSFIFDAWDALSSFEGAAARLQTFEPEVVKELSVVAHRLKGTAALYRYPQISSLAELAERLLEGSSRLPEAEAGRVRAFLEKVAVCLQDALTRIAAGKNEGNLGLELSYLGGATLFQQLLRDNRAAFARSGSKARAAGPAQSLSLSGLLRSFFIHQRDDWEFFAPEASEHLDLLADTLQTVRREGADAEHLSTLFRSTHTLKGAAYMVGLTPMGDLAHLLEDLMVEVREGDRPFDGPTQGALSGGVEALALMLPTAAGQTTEVERVTREARARLQTQLGRAVDAPVEAEPAEPAAATAADAQADAGIVTALGLFRVQNPDLWPDFSAEVLEHARTIFGACAAAEREGAADEHVSAIFRAAHTVKGAAAAVGCPHLPDVAFRLERLAIEVREQGLAFDASVGDAFVSGAALLEQVVKAAEGDEHNGDYDLAGASAAFAERYAPFAEASDEAAAETSVAVTADTDRSAAATIRVSLSKLDTLMTLSNELVTARSRVDRLLDELGGLTGLLDASRTRLARTVGEFEERYLNPRLQAMSPSGPESGGESGADSTGLRASLTERFDELEFDSYSDLNILARSVAEMSGDLTEVQGQFSRLEAELREQTGEVAALTGSLRSEIGRARMVAVRGLFGRLRRLMTEVPGKSYTFKVSGENVEVDNLILEGVADPLLHLVKNAVAHGVEPESVRLAAGKSASGSVAVRARHQGNRVVIDVADDGAGIDVAAVKAKALERGLITPEAAAAMSEQQALNLIFLPGLSTAAEVTTDAGRGVGMEAVATNIARLKGEIDIHTERGRGTRFTLSLPLTLIVTETLMLQVAEQRLAVPADAVRGLRDVLASEITVQGGHKQLVFDGRATDYYSLRELLGYPAVDAATVQVALLETGSTRLAVGVDAFLELEESVVRGLEAPLKALTHLAGAAVSSTGEVALVLDPAGLHRLTAGAGPEGVQAVQVPLAAPAPQHHLLLVDDSVSVRKVVAKLLARAGYRVTTAADGVEATERLRAETFDALLTDLEMPRMSGYELLEEVRARPATAQLPVVVMTSRAGEKHMQLAFELGATDYLTKPVDETKLLAFLARTVAARGTPAQP